MLLVNARYNKKYSSCCVCEFVCKLLSEKNRNISGKNRKQLSDVSCIIDGYDTFFTCDMSIALGLTVSSVCSLHQNLCHRCV